MSEDKRTARFDNNKSLSAIKHSSSLFIDSGWDENRPEGERVSVSFCTTRGMAVNLSIADWQELKAKVEAIIRHCAEHIEKVSQ